MESISYPIIFGEIVRKERNARNLNQVEFYKFLFPNTCKEEENIKKTMNAIENGKRSSVSIDFFMAFCEKCDVSADYLIGNDHYRNHDIAYICEYTGLTEKTVRTLHGWQDDANNGADISIIGNAFWGDEGEKQMEMAYSKMYALQYLRILNYLFSEYETKEKFNGKQKRVKYSNTGVLYALHQLCITKPYRLKGKLLFEETFGHGYEYILARDPFLKNCLDSVSLNATDTMVLQDENDVWYPLNINSVFEQIARNHLNKSIDRLIESIKKEFSQKQIKEVVHQVKKD